jgi:hypothetical protein
MSHVRPIVAGLAAALVMSASASAADYPPAAAPGAPQAAPKGPFHTRQVCTRSHRAKGCFATIQKAVDAAKAGDTVRVPDGTYREAVTISGAKKRSLKLVGNVAKPSRVILEGGGKKQNGVFVDGADNVTTAGFTAHDYGANGFFYRNVVGYTMNKLVANLTGKYGLYVFNSKGGTIRDSVGTEANDAGLYIGQTPPQTKPLRTTVTGMVAYANVLGVSAENMKYTTITKSTFYNNAIGIAFSAQDGEKYAPPSDNDIVGNQIFWNNFNYYKGAPFPINKNTNVPYPPGLGIVIFGGQRITIQDNDIYGNWVAGVSSLQGFLTKLPGASDLIGNAVEGNRFGRGGTDLNGRDFLADGNGSGNCWGPNTGVQVTYPDTAASFPACPFAGANAFSKPVQDQMLAWLVAADHESPYIVHPHAPKPGYTPLEHWTKGS